MTVYQIRERIAESGKMRIKDVVDYFKHRAPEADIKIVKAEAKEMIKEAKKYMQGFFLRNELVLLFYNQLKQITCQKDSKNY